MKRRLRDPFFITRGVNLVLGIVALLLFIVSIWRDGGTELYQILLFALAAVINAVSAVISLSEAKKVRGNICAIICAVFFVVAVVLAVGYLLGI